MSELKKPWPMKRVVIAIIAIIVPYTFLTLYYRKPGRANEPYHDLKNQAVTKRLLDMEYRRVALDAMRPASHPAGAADQALTSVAAGGLPADLKDALIDAPRLPLSIDQVWASRSTTAGTPYPIQFTCSLADFKEQLSGASLYLKDDELVLVPAFEQLNGNLAARARESTVQITIPPSLLKPGKYAVTLIGARASRMWMLQVH